MSVVVGLLAHLATGGRRDRVADEAESAIREVRPATP